MKIKTQFRQGDVLIERADSVPDKAVKQKPGERVILAHGEVTGHAHEIACGDAEAWKQDADTVAVVVKKQSKITHQEHAEIPIARGTYKITRQREYTPQAIRRVAD